MPFFQNARHFMVNGPNEKTDNGGPPINSEEIERKVSSTLQAVDQRIAQSAFVNGQPAPTVGANSQLLSFSSGSSSFNGHMGQMSEEEKGYLNAELAKMKRQLKEMDERKAQKRANGGRRKGGLNGTPVGQGNSGRFPPEVPPTMATPMDLPPMGHLPPPDMSGLGEPYSLPPPDDFSAMAPLPNPDPFNDYQGLSHPYPGQGYPPPPVIDPAQKYLLGSPPFQFLNTSVVNPLNPSPENKEAHELGPDVSQNVDEPQRLSPPPKQKNRFSPGRFTSSLPK